MADIDRAAVQATVLARFAGGPLFEAKTNERGAARWGGTFVLEEGEDAKIEKAFDAAIRAQWPNKLPPRFEKHGVRTGDDPEFDASYGRKFVNPKASKAPRVLRVLGGRQVDTTKDDGIVYPGCLVAVSVNAYAYSGDKDKNINPGASLNLRAVLYRGPGERLGDVTRPEHEFAGVAVADTVDGFGAVEADDATSKFLDDDKPW